MAERSLAVPTEVAMQQLGLTAANVERRKRYVGLEPADIERLALIRDLVAQNAARLSKTFFEFLAGIEEAQVLLKHRAVAAQAAELKTQHLIAMAGGDYGMEYVQQRVTLGLIYSKVGLDPRLFLGAFHEVLRNLGALIMQQHQRNPFEAFDAFMSLKKIAFFDIGLIIDVLMMERERVIFQQQEAIRELSTPVLQIRDRLLLLPIIGVIDTHRAQLITEGLLRAIRSNRARVAVMDVTGVANIDSKVANHLLQTVTAAKLMGASVIVTGVSSEVAQSLVALGVDVSRFNTIGDLQGGLEHAEQQLGYRVVLEDSRATRAV